MKITEPLNLSLFNSSLCTDSQPLSALLPSHSLGKSPNLIKSGLLENLPHSCRLWWPEQNINILSGLELNAWFLVFSSSHNYPDLPPLSRSVHFSSAFMIVSQFHFCSSFGPTALSSTNHGSPFHKEMKLRGTFRPALVARLNLPVPLGTRASIGSSALRMNWTASKASSCGSLQLCSIM